MKDKVTIERVALLHPAIRTPAGQFIDAVEAKTGLTWRIVQGLRTFGQQEAFYAQGRTAPGPIVTYSPAGSSYHNYGLAFDQAPFLPDMSDLNWHYAHYKDLEDLALTFGFTWGGEFPHPDTDHFENKKGYNWRDLLHRYTIKDFIAGTTYVNL